MQGAGFLPRLRAEFLHPEPLGSPVGHVKVAPVPAVALAQTNRLPSAGFVRGAGVGLRIGESLRQKHTVTESLLPLGGQRPARRSQSL